MQRVDLVSNIADERVVALGGVAPTPHNSRGSVMALGGRTHTPLSAKSPRLAPVGA
mgnify:CR=1 FL=1